MTDVTCYADLRAWLDQRDPPPTGPILKSGDLHPEEAKRRLFAIDRAAHLDLSIRIDEAQWRIYTGDYKTRPVFSTMREAIEEYELFKRPAILNEPESLVNATEAIVAATPVDVPF